MRGTGGLAVGELAPPLELADTDGELQTLPMPGEAPAAVVVWTCNHCPYALAWHDRIVDAYNDYAGGGVRFLNVNSNDAERYPRDSLEAMKERAEAEKWPFPYLHDADQEAARAWGALTTPDVFVLDSDLRLRYRGAPDPDHEDPSHDGVWLREALDAVLAGKEPERHTTESVGCSIKWKEE